MDFFDLSVVNWSRGQFAMSAMFHWVFVPLTLGLSILVAIMETIYLRTGDESWKKMTKFWAKLLDQLCHWRCDRYHTRVSVWYQLVELLMVCWRYFGAPLAIEGIMAFFLEATL